MIEYLRDARIFHLHNEFLSLVLLLRDDEKGMPELLQAYLGAPLDDPRTAVTFRQNEGASFDSLRQILPYACPTDGRGDYRPPMVSVAVRLSPFSFVPAAS